METDTPTPLTREDRQLMRDFVFGEASLESRGWTWDTEDCPDEWEHPDMLSGDEDYARSSQLATDVLDLLSEVSRLNELLEQADSALSNFGGPIL